MKLIHVDSMLKPWACLNHVGFPFHSCISSEEFLLLIVTTQIMDLSEGLSFQFYYCIKRRRSFARRLSTALVWIWETRDSDSSMTCPISLSVNSS